MALIFADLVEETTTTTGTGSYTLAGAATGFQSFSAGIGTSNETFYAVTDGTDWEVSRGVLSDSTTLTRATVLDSSNSGSAVNWSAGTRRIYAVAPADIFSQTPAADRLVWLENVGGNPGLPAVDGSQLTNMPPGVIAEFQEFTTSGTWNKAAGATWVYVEAVGGGGSGRSETTANAPGGGGGLFGARLFRAVDLGASEAVTVGAGGAAVAAGNAGLDGGASSFGAHLSVPGGESGGSVNASRGGRAGKLFGNSSTTAGGADQYGNYAGGAGSNVTTNGFGIAGNAVKGGAGGGAAKSGTGAGFTAGGSSVLGGDGGAGSTSGNATDGAVPGGGGGGCCDAGGSLSGAGGDGVVRVWQW